MWWIFLGGGLGALGRWWVSGWVATRVGETFPWGTLVVNVSGSMLAGFLAGLMLPEGRWWLPSEVRQFLMLGICGGYTTFSSFSLQTLHLMQEREWLAAVGNVGLSVVACLTAVWLGYTLALWLQTFRNG
ncbi:MAG: fluoride efflux transporter CrcB [Verrucomicrobiota bacterium]|nr:fluoride efflux transporter CrcB [Verrucomicrobiota bacterium]